MVFWCVCLSVYNSSICLTIAERSLLKASKGYEISSVLELREVLTIFTHLEIGLYGCFTSCLKKRLNVHSFTTTISFK